MAMGSWKDVPTENGIWSTDKEASDRPKEEAPERPEEDISDQPEAVIPKSLK